MSVFHFCEVVLKINSISGTVLSLSQSFDNVLVLRQYFHCLSLVKVLELKCLGLKATVLVFHSLLDARTECHQ